MATPYFVFMKSFWIAENPCQIINSSLLWSHILNQLVFSELVICVLQISDTEGWFFLLISSAEILLTHSCLYEAFLPQLVLQLFTENKANIAFVSIFLTLANKILDVKQFFFSIYENIDHHFHMYSCMRNNWINVL